jgi:hypothetical protein
VYLDLLLDSGKSTFPKYAWNGMQFLTVRSRIVSADRSLMLMSSFVIDRSLTSLMSLSEWAKGALAHSLGPKRQQ